MTETALSDPAVK